MRTAGVVVADRGSAIVTVDRDGEAMRCSAIERLPFDLGAVSGRVRSLDAQTSIVVDSEGLGSALWAVVGRPEEDDPDAERHFTLYEGHGRERQALVDRLLVAVEEDRFRFAPGLPEQDAMSKALQGYRRQVREDGLIGSELVVALLLAMTPPPPVEEPSIYETRGIIHV